MKKIIFISVLLLLNINKGNAYQSIFGVDSTQWNIVSEIIDGANTVIFKTETGSDTIINGNTYSILNGQDLFLREDTTSGKVWSYRNSIGTETPLMDLSIQLNDTFWIYRYVIDSMPVIVDSVYQLNGLKHIRFNTYIFPYSEKFEFIEGIGTNAGIDYQYEFFLSSYIDRQLLCKYNDTTQVYANTAFNGDCIVNWTTINEITNTDHIHISPNPVRRNELLKFNIQNEDIQSFCVYNLNGKLLNNYQSHEIKPKEEPGMYIVVVTLKNGSIQKLKLVITD